MNIILLVFQELGMSLCDLLTRFKKVIAGYRGQAGIVAWIRNCHKKGVIPAQAGIQTFLCHAELVSASLVADPEINSG